MKNPFLQKAIGHSADFPEYIVFIEGLAALLQGLHFAHDAEVRIVVPHRKTA